jgi:hypothetical protein
MGVEAAGITHPLIVQLMAQLRSVDIRCIEHLPLALGGDGDIDSFLLNTRTFPARDHASNSACRFSPLPGRPCQSLCELRSLFRGYAAKRYQLTFAGLQAFVT